MKLVNTIKKYSKVTVVAATVAIGQVSCSDYLDVVPPEQATLPDAVRDYDETLKFAFSCYAGIANPINYSTIEGAADEYVLPPLWRESMHNILYGLNTPLSPQEDRWNGNYYSHIGQCHLFMEHLPIAKGITDQQRKEFEAEAKFLRAYYHMQTLFLYGPCPIIEKFYPQGTPSSEFPGRSHFDYVVDWISNQYDEVALVLPASRTGEEWGRATSTMAKALKARLLVYAASPLWNGEFPYPEWKNTNYETPGYGKDLVSINYDANKWQRAKVACEEAINFATSNGYALFTDENFYATQTGVNLPYVPGVNPATPAGQAFLKKVMLMRYVVNTRVTEGNRETIWGIADQGNWLYGAIPHFVLQRSNGTDFGYYSGISPILNTSIHYFYTNQGKRPAHGAQDGSFIAENNWYRTAGIAGRTDIINLNVNREPRFYAWFAFDGGDYSNRLNNGQPFRIELRNANKQGFNREKYNRDNNVTGYFSQKFIVPNSFMAPSGSFSSESKPRSLVRLAELYLNLAECHAALGNVSDAITNLNVIRSRAGVPDLTTADMASQSIMDWVRNERFIELWGEGHRYYDVRRWVIANETMADGARKGLNAYGIKNPTFDEFNTVVPIQQEFRWQNKMYLHPVFRDEVYRNPQLVQAPGY